MQRENFPCFQCFNKKSLGLLTWMVSGTPNRERARTGLNCSLIPEKFRAFQAFSLCKSACPQLPWVPEVFSCMRRPTQSSLAKGRGHKQEKTGHFLRLD